MHEMEIEVVNRESASLLELILEALLKTAVQDPGRLERLQKARGSYRIQAGRMECFLEVAGGRILIDRYAGQQVDAHIKGTISAFFNLGTGSLSPFPFIKGEIKVKGKMKKALNLGLALRGGKR